MLLIVFALCIFFANIDAYVNVVSLNQNNFPENFLFGVATSSYQVEGAWNKNGKGENIWDRFCHSNPEKIIDGTNGDIAADSYHKYKEDIKLLKELGVNFYKFSLSWSRILPTGHSNDINEDGIRYYKNLLSELLREGITPMVTIYHGDLPQPLQDLGGWANPLIIDYFVDYARVVFDSFGEQVPYWITVNKPYMFCTLGYARGVHAPSYKMGGIADYQCIHHQLLAHARVYWLFKNDYQGQGKTPQNARMSLSLEAIWYEPKRADNEDDKMAAAVQSEFHLGMTANPIFGSGDYPKVVKDLVRRRSIEEGYPHSRLPQFTAEEVGLLKGSADFFALNYYSHSYAQHTIHPIYKNSSSMEMDAQVTITYPAEDPPSTYEFRVKSPRSFRKMLKHISTLYDNPLLIITENGYSSKEELKDCRRIQFLQEYLSSLLEAIYEDKCNAIGYAVWSLLDSFEWIEGFSQRYGLYYVDITREDRRRTAKDSAKEYARIITNRKLPEKSMDVAICSAGSNCVNPQLLTSAFGLIITYIMYK